MSIIFSLLIIFIIGTVSARQPDIDINRIKLLPRGEHRTRSPNYHSRRSIVSDYYRRNDYDHHSSRFTELRPQMHILDDAPPITEAETGKVYQPREDPRFFYQSDAYIEENNRKNLNNEIASIHLGRGVVRANEQNFRSLPIRLRDNELNSIDEGMCVQCPHDRTLIAKAGVDRAMLQHPRILTCSGRKAARAVRFTRMYGPDIGTLLEEGSHILIGRISYKGRIVQTCKMQIHVLLQSCAVPKYLVSHCDSQNKTCSFTCRDPKAELRGRSILTCGKDLQWSGRLPICNARTWCTPPPPPDHGRISCKGVTSPNNGGLAEGARCRLRCARGWHWNPTAVAICRQGVWSHGLTCLPQRF